MLSASASPETQISNKILTGGMASSNGIHAREFSYAEQWQKTKIGGTAFALLAPSSPRPLGHVPWASSAPPGVSVVSSDSLGVQPASFVQIGSRWRAENMGTGGSALQIFAKYKLISKYRLLFF
jgi:hypothetical protein